MAHHDPLTGAKNRRAYDEFMRNLPQLLSESGVGVCFALFDINHFKAINDSYGHGIGDRVLKVMRKPTTAEQIRSAVKSARDAGILVVGSVILPAPGDTEETMEETFSLLTEIRPDSIFIQFPGIYPRTPWAEQPEQYGFTLDRASYLRHEAIAGLCLALLGWPWAV